MNRMSHSQFFLILFTAISMGYSALQAEPGGGKAPGTLSKEERQTRATKHEKMAEAHKKMAECLRSDKEMKECHEQMRKDMPEGMGHGGHGGQGPSGMGQGRQSGGPMGMGMSGPEEGSEQ